MNRRKFLSFLGIAPIATKLKWIKPVEPALALSKDAFKIVAASLPLPLTRGDVITFGGVYDVHPMIYKVMPNLKRFVVTDHVDGKMQYHPVPCTKGFYTNCNRLPFGPPRLIAKVLNL